MIPQIRTEEARNACGCPERWQLTDAFGAMLGGYLLVDGSRRLQHRYDRWALVEAVLGGLALYLHSERFLYSRPQLCAQACAPRQP
jgi:hypothetical protein